MDTPFRLYHDFISPYAYLHLRLLRSEYRDIPFTPVPVLLGALLQHHQQKGPAEIPGKRTVTYRNCVWLAQKHNIPFRFPAVHPFKPLGPLRLAIAMDAGVEQLEKIYHAIWVEGRDLSDPENLEALAAEMGFPGHAERISQDPVKEQLKTNTTEAAALGVFGVPTLEHNGHLFWGVDMLGLARDYAADPGLLDKPPYSALGKVSDGLNVT